MLAAIERFLEKMNDTRVDFFKYQNGKRRGFGWHGDGWALFGTVIVIVNDSPVGMIHNEDLRLLQRVSLLLCALHLQREKSKHWTLHHVCQCSEMILGSPLLVPS